MSTFRSLLLFVLAALAEIGGAWLVWQGWREHRGVGWIAADILALGFYGFVATFQPDPHFGRILAAYGGIFVVGSLAWGVIVDRFHPDRWDYAGTAICYRVEEIPADHCATVNDFGAEISSSALATTAGSTNRTPSGAG